MDFSSVPRALESLQRRRPPMDQDVLDAANDLLRVNEQVSAPVAATTINVNEKLDLLLNHTRWEALAVGLYVSTQILKQSENNIYPEGPRIPSTSNSITAESFLTSLTSEASKEELADTLHRATMEHLEHTEPRVRTLVAKAIGVAVGDSVEKTRELNSKILHSIRTHIQTGRDESENHSKSSQGALDDTTGWRALETNWQCLAALISARGGAYLDAFSIEEFLDDCEYSSITHVNRHVRAAGMNVLENTIKAAEQNIDHHHHLLEGKLRKTIQNVLKGGLADNWSQVRMAASVLCRVFITTLQSLHSSLDDLYPTLIPRMCLNRFYLAQGVKLYSHETWKIVFQESGLPVVVKNLPAVCRYYVQMCDADNHVVREAACQAIAELSTRITEDLRPHVDLLLQALLMCFHDESWPVRDEACLACGIICKAYPEECRPELKTLWSRWTEQLTDQIWSVRQDAAVALGDALEAYGNTFLDELRQFLKKNIGAARDQPAMSMDDYKAHMNDLEAHSNSQLYSCGSLAPKLRKGGAGRIGCSNCGIDRPKAPWEATDGCIYLIRELVIKCSSPTSSTPMSDDELISILKELADVCRVQHFPQSSDLRATLWRQLPIIARALGKDRYKKQYFYIFLDLMFSNLDSRSASALSKHAAGQCAEELSDLIGKAMFRGRLDDFQVETFDRVMKERSMMPRGPVDDGAFSPFGPPGLLDSINAGRLPQTTK